MGNLVQELKEFQDNRALWEDFVGALYQKVMYSAYRLTSGDIQSAQDLVQQAFTRFIEYGCIHRISDDEHALAYLRTIVRSLWSNEYKRRLREVSKQSMDDIPATEDVDKEELREDLSYLLKSISEDDKLLIEMLFGGHTLTVVAERLGISYSNAAVKFHRLKKDLRAKYAKKMK